MHSGYLYIWEMPMDPLAESTATAPIQCERPSSSAEETRRATSPCLEATRGFDISDYVGTQKSKFRT